MTLTVTELVLATLAVLVLLALLTAQRYRVAGANEALVISGARGSKVRDEKGDLITIHDQGVKVVVGAGTFTWPLINKVGRLQLTARQVEIGLAHENAAVTKQGVGVLITGQAMFKIAREPERLRAAAERFIGEPDSQIETMVKKVLEGSLRSIAGTLTIEELITDRDRFQQAVSEAARGDLEASGIHIDALTITSIRAAEAQAKQVELVGQAEGAAILARGQAEARAKELLADAYRKFDEAAVLLQTLPLVPPIVREAAAPLGNINNLTVVDPSGASKLTETVARTAAEGSAIAKSLLGIDLADLMRRLAARSGDKA